MKVAFEIQGIELLTSHFERMIGGVGNMRQFFPPVIKEFEQIQTDWFATQGRGSWAPLSASYALWKSVHAPGQPLLVLTGDLRDSKFKTQQENDSVTITNEAPEYWSYHQFGTSKMPARPPYVVDNELQDALAKKFSSSLVDFFKR